MFSRKTLRQVVRPVYLCPRGKGEHGIGTLGPIALRREHLERNLQVAALQALRNGRLLAQVNDVSALHLKENLRAVFARGVPRAHYVEGLSHDILRLNGRLVLCRTLGRWRCRYVLFVAHFSLLFSPVRFEL